MNGSAALRAAAVGAGLLLVAAKPMPATIQGVFALPSQQVETAATLTATPGELSETAGPGVSMTLSVTMARVGAKRAIDRYRGELGGQLHLVAVSDDLRRLVRADGGAPDKHGRIAVPVRFPDSGFYWVYADATPSGLDQQVFRFELRVGTARGASAPPPAPALPPPSLEAADGAYTVRFAPFALEAGQPATLHLAILHGTDPARDVAPYLGVAAQATLISARDHAYVPVQAMPDQPVRTGGDAAPASVRSPESAPASLALHLTPPAPGPYRLWLQFLAGGQVRIAAFTVETR